jgi:galactose-1-phosphate uridylyltransferase
MRSEKECHCCGAVYLVTFVQPKGSDEAWHIEDETFEGDSDEIYPEFCPFCGSHEDDEPEDEEEES